MCSLLKQIYVKGKSLSHSKLHLIKLHISTTKTVKKNLSITALQNGIQVVKTQGKLTTMYSRHQTFGDHGTSKKFKYIQVQLCGLELV